MTHNWFFAVGKIVMTNWTGRELADSFFFDDFIKDSIVVISENWLGNGLQLGDEFLLRVYPRGDGNDIIFDFLLNFLQDFTHH